MSSSSSFEFIAKGPDTCPIAVEKYVSKQTGMRLYVCGIKGPVVDGYISLGTEASSDDGLPHTLEHMIFLGSEDYPYSGILDVLANKVYASGTNAWTDVDNTTYTLSTAEKLGFLQLLPIYLDHVLYPLLNESGFITEVYHVNGEGEDAGVVYSEMQSHENEDETIVQRAMHKLMYQNEDCGYRYETGGALHNLRTSTTYDKVLEFHRAQYKPENMAIVVAGEISSSEVIEVLEKFEQKILSKNPETWKLTKKPFSTPIEPLTQSHQEVVYFPCDEEKASHGVVSIGWRGPRITELEELFAIDILFSYLTESSISPLQSYFIQKHSLCSRVNYTIEEYKETSIMLSFINAQIEHLHELKSKLDEILNSLFDRQIDLDLKRLTSIIKMKMSELRDKFEDHPHDTISKLCIGDFLYGDDSEHMFTQRLEQVEIFEKLRNEKDEYWLRVVEKWFYKTNTVTIIAKPSEELSRKVGEEDKQRVNERKTRLGKKGLRELEKKVENAIDQNDNTEVPEEVYGKLVVPSLDNLKLREIVQYHTHSVNGSSDGLLNLERLRHLQMQIDHMKDTEFFQVSLAIDTSSIDVSLRKYLKLYVKLLFESPIKNDDVNLTHDEVVYELNKDLLEYDATIGIDGDECDFGNYPQYLWVYAKVAVKHFDLAVKWLKYVLFDNVMDKEQLKIGIEKLLKEISHRKQNSFDVLQCVINDIHFQKDSNFWLNSLLRQEKFIKNEVLESLEKNEDEKVFNKLYELKGALLKDTQLRFYVCADLTKLSNDKQDLHNTLSKYFPHTLLNSNKPFDVAQTWQFKYKQNDNPFVGHDYVIGLGTTESAFLRVTSTIEIDSYTHADYARLLVLKQYFCQLEGPLWEAVRGPGYAYHESIEINPETAQLELILDECSNVTKAYDATRKLFKSHLSQEEEFDDQLLETAKNSLIFTLIDDLKSVSGISEYSMMCHFKNVNMDTLKELFKNIQNVELDDLEPLLEKYIMPMFDEVNSNCVIVCNPSKLESITKDFSQKFDRKLINIGKLDESFCAEW